MNTANVITMRLNRSPAKSKDGAQNAIFFQQVIDKVKTLPGVEVVGVASHMPFVFTEDWTVTIDNQAGNQATQTQNVDTRTVSSDYFSALGIPLRAGEAFSQQDGPNASPVVVLNQTMAHHFWPNENPLGKRLKLGSEDSKSPWFTVKGVVADSAQGSLEANIHPEVYFALGQMAWRYRRMNIAVRTSVDPKNLAASIQRAIREVDANQPAYQIQTLAELTKDSI